MHYDFLIIGCGIVGLSTGYTIMKKYPKAKLLLLEKESEWAAHQTGRNSGVIHSGIYYKPGSLKAKFAKEGGEKLIHFCQEYGIHYDICGKIIVATEDRELIELDKLYNRGLENGLKIEKLNKNQMQNIEPSVNGVAAIKVPMAGIVDYKKVSEAFAHYMLNRGGELKTETAVEEIHENDNEIIVGTNRGTFYTKHLINCAGLFSDRIAKLAGIDPKMKIIPFRGEYYKLKESKSHLVKNLIYPVPDPKFPFLGVHLTRMTNGEIHAGPNAVLALKREGYKKTDFDLNDIYDVLSYPAFWKIAKQNMKYGLAEMYRSFNKNKFLESLRKLVPDIEKDDLVEADSGVRAQALSIDGKLIDDFMIIKSKRSIHVCNAPSPAATASIAIGEEIVSNIDHLDLVAI
ncbi:L-2-hydroxyglutarate oxidase [Heyndrickxia sp. NPDC080065]|uniref:L-2-hydroxyglutarate oxidase n=1 Tax=Heyndrickxia sp. NPDC080065 TaxID=3390568 RepID=UPI003CFDA2DA